MVQAKETGISLSQAREVRAPRPVRRAHQCTAHVQAPWQVYRPVAARCALLYFLIDALNALDRVYHFSMANFVLALKKGALGAHMWRACAESAWYYMRPQMLNMGMRCPRDGRRSTCARGAACSQRHARGPGGRW